MVGMVFSGYSQKTIKKDDIIKGENVQKVANIYKEAKKYKYDSEYVLQILETANFTYEFLVNDLPIISNYEPGSIVGSMSINEAILKPGVQTITVRMTPLVDENYKMSNEIDLSTVVLRFMIDYRNYKKEKLVSFKEVFKYELPKEQDKVPYYELNLVFDVLEVPYQYDIIGWDNSVDLSKDYKEDLLKEVEAFYREMIDLYSMSRDVNGLASKYYVYLRDLSRYKKITKSQEFQRYIDYWVTNVNDQRPFVFSGYEMKFYGNGRLVKLAKMDDRYYLNRSALLRTDSEGIYVDYDILLHRPYPGAPLEIIR